MARAVEVFRENAMQVRDMSEEERAGLEQRRDERAAMLEQLQRAFGVVVEAAIAGDFSKRVEAEFPRRRAQRAGRAASTIWSKPSIGGLRDTGEVLAALADTDLTLRMEGDYQGAFGRLAADTNAVSDKLADIVGEIRGTSRALKTATARSSRAPTICRSAPR